MFQGTPTRDEQRALARQTGLRLKEARERAALSQQDAARLLGYSNSTKLSKIESGLHSSQIPLWALKRAAELYDVSLDWITGDADKAPARDDDPLARDMMIFMRAAWLKLKERDDEVQGMMLARIESLEDETELVARDAEDAQESLIRMIELNKQSWQGMRGGVRLETAINDAEMHARQLRNRTRKYRKRVVKPESPQVDLVFI